MKDHKIKWFYAAAVAGLIVLAITAFTPLTSQSSSDLHEQILQQVTGTQIISTPVPTSTRTPTATFIIGGGGGGGGGPAGNTTPQGPFGQTGKPGPVFATSTPIVRNVVVEVAQDDNLGTYLTDVNGRTLYMSFFDLPNFSTCTGSCTAAWPPFTGKPVPGPGVIGGMLGFATTQNGTIVQATYANHPLYYYSGDHGPGSFNGQGLQNAFFIISPDGQPITEMITPTPTFGIP
jgi:predicted lipoprotein with Yx(FWY)xxD motif